MHQLRLPLSMSKQLEDYLFYEEKNPDIKIYCGDMFASWYNMLITRRMLWVRKKVTSNRKNILKNGSVLARSTTLGKATLFLKKVVGRGLCACLKLSGLAQYAEVRNQSAITSTETRQITIRQTSKSPAENAIWSLMAGWLGLQRWQKRLAQSVKLLPERLGKCRRIASVGMSFQALMQMEREYVEFA